MDDINHRWFGRAIATGKIAANAARLASRRALGRAEDRTDGAIGGALAAELDRMKGLAMKIGQILSYLEGTLPEATHEALRLLQRGAEPLDFAVIQPVIEQALGAPIEALFDSIEPRAIAAASIGQVHRATYAGRAVAVKVQYPRVRETFDADFQRVDAIARLASLATSVDGAALAAELRERVIEECDYQREAASQRAFAAAFADDGSIRVPTVIAERSASTVLTTEWCDGDEFYAFAAEADADRRNDAARTLTRIAYRSFFVFAVLHADPHPGNYLFGDRHVVLLDFGCVRRFTVDYLARERALLRTVLDGRRAEFDDAVIATGMVPDARRFDFDAHWSLLRYQYEPYLHAPYRFTLDYLRRGAEFTRAGKPNARRLAIPPPWIWQQRTTWGLHAVLARLGAECDFRAILEEALAEPTRPLAI